MGNMLRGSEAISDKNVTLSKKCTEQDRNTTIQINQVTEV